MLYIGRSLSHRPRSENGCSKNLNVVKASTESSLDAIDIVNSLLLYVAGDRGYNCTSWFAHEENLMCGTDCDCTLVPMVAQTGAAATACQRHGQRAGNFYAAGKRLQYQPGAEKTL
jgi:hypothetical protein